MLMAFLLKIRRRWRISGDLGGCWLKEMEEVAMGAWIGDLSDESLKYLESGDGRRCLK